MNPIVRKTIQRLVDRWDEISFGYPVKLCLPANASPERKQILKAYGAEVVLTDPGEGSDGAIRVCRKIYQENPELYFYPDQLKGHVERTYHPGQ